jgi:hypothetical protein
MNRATKITELPALTVDLLQANGVLIDNVFASLWREIGMKTVLSRIGFNKRSGTPMNEVIFGLMLWLWLKKFWQKDAWTIVRQAHHKSSHFDHTSGRHMMRQQG